jgi:hypothetical protein
MRVNLICRLQEGLFKGFFFYSNLQPLSRKQSILERGTIDLMNIYLVQLGITLSYFQSNLNSDNIAHTTYEVGIPLALQIFPYAMSIIQSSFLNIHNPNKIYSLGD